MFKSKRQPLCGRPWTWGGLSAASGLIGFLALGALTLGAAPPFGDWGAGISIDPSGALGINTAALEGCPIESPDGDLFIASNRPGGQGGIDIWVATEANGSFEAPANLPAPVNSSADDFCPTPLPGRRLLFVSARPSLCGGGTDIYETRLHPVRGWMEPKNLGCQVNSSAGELSPSLIEAEGQVILFFSSNRTGKQQIYQSVLGSDGEWGAAQAVVELNSSGEDARPNVRKDGLEIVFDSTRQGGNPDIWTAWRRSVTEPWYEPIQLGPNVNSAAGESRPSISRDGTRLYFGSTRDGGLGASDVYVSHRSGPGKGKE